MKNSTRNLVKIIKEICDEEDIECKSIAYDWVFQLYKNGMYNYIYGYKFGLNNASVDAICCDKSAASEIMSSLNIPNIEHYFFMSPIDKENVNDAGSWNFLIGQLKEHGSLVIKSNNGSGGDLVFRVCNQFELEKAVFKIFQHSCSLAVCPYYEIKNEYRAIVLDGEIKLIYSKMRPCVYGDGKQSIKNLFFEYLLKENYKDFDIDLSGCDMSEILDEGKRFELNWKHNLGQGSKAIILQDKETKNKIENLIGKVTENFNLRFASIDIAETGNEYKVLEINSGVMMEFFSRQDDKSYNIAKEIYRETILKMFN